MKIVFLSASGQLGGAERELLDLLAALREERPNWDLALICAAEGPVLERARQLGVSVSVVPFPRPVAALGDAGASSALLVLRALAAFWHIGRYVAQLRRSLHEAAPDVVHSNGLKMDVLAAAAGVREAPLV